MLKHYSNTGQTSFPSFAPDQGKKWKILELLLILNASSTAGSRRFALYTLFNGTGQTMQLLADTGSQTTVSSNYYAIFGYSETGSGTVPYTYAFDSVYVTEFSQITPVGTLISGDTIGWYLTVEETDA